MRAACFALMLLPLLPVAAEAQTAAITWTGFTDPTENAFGAEVPQGWTVKGGVSRFSLVDARQWLTAVSPDGMTQIFIGDPLLPPFVVPQRGQPEGAQVPAPNTLLRAGMTLNYRAGSDFAQYYGPKQLAVMGCSGARITGNQPRPDIAAAQSARAADQLRGLAPPGFVAPPQDAALVGFACQSGGRAFSAGIIADTAQPGGGGIWNADLVAGFVTPSGQEAAALDVLNRILASRQYNPQWDAAAHDEAQKMLAAQARQGAQELAALAAMEAGELSLLKAQGDADQAALTASHNATMAQLGQQSAAESAQFTQNEFNKGLNAWKFNAYVRNGNVYQNPANGQYYEVDP